MKDIFPIIFAVVFSYLLGSLNSSITVVRLWKKVDIREYGSKNAGLTNTLRVFGKGPALATLICDLAKGAIAVLATRLVAHICGSFDETLAISYVAGIVAMLGHIFPVYYGFKGGKGVLVAGTTLLAIDPITFCIVIPLFIIILYFTRYVSVSSIVAVIGYPVFTFITQMLRDVEEYRINTLLAMVICIIVIFMHRTNIQRLKNGTENKFSFKK